MTLEEALGRLDEIERLAPDVTADAGAAEALGAAARAEGGLRLLVERYAATASANVAVQLAILLAEHSQRSTPETAPLVFEFAARLRRDDLDGVLVTVLGAMQRQLTFGAGWGDAPEPPPVLAQLLRHCLDYSGRQHVLVQFAAVELLSVLCRRRLLGRTFGPGQLEWVEGRAAQLSLTDNDLLRDAVKEFEQCLHEEGRP